MDWREAVAPYLLRGLLLRLAVLIQLLCSWHIDLALPIHPFVVGGTCGSEGQMKIIYPPGYVGSLLVVLRTVVAPITLGAARLCVYFSLLSLDIL